jgi:hypothetical protein
VFALQKLDIQGCTFSSGMMKMSATVPSNQLIETAKAD